MIQRSKSGLKFFSPAFSSPCLSSGPVNRSDMWHITVALPAQKDCAQTISANVLKHYGSVFFYFRDHVTEVNYIVVASAQIFPVCLFSSSVSLQQKTTWASGQNWKRNARRWLHIPKNWRKGLSMHGVHKDASTCDPTVLNQSRLSRAAFPRGLPARPSPTQRSEKRWTSM